MADNIKKIFSSPVTTIIVVLAALAGRILIQIHFTVFESDRAFQVQAAQNFLDGHGLTIQQVFTNDLSKIHFIPLEKWPPGYSFFLIPFLLLCKSDFFLAIILLDALTAILFIFFSRKLLSKFQVPVYWLNIYTLVSGFFIFEFCTTSTSDFLTLTIYIAALYFTISIIQFQGKNRSLSFLVALLLFLTAFTRFMFIPVAFVIPVYLIVYGYLRKNKLVLKKGFTVLGILIFFLTTFFLFQKSYTGAATFIIETKKGFYPEHLLLLYPFIFSSFINLNMICVQLSKITGLSFSTVYTSLPGIHLCLLGIIFFLIIRGINKKKIFRGDIIDHFLFIGILSGCVIVTLLAYLSFRNKLIVIDWTFIQEGRYFAFLVFFLQLLLFLSISQKTLLLKKGGRLIGYGAFGVLILSTLHGIYFVIKVATTQIYSYPTARNVATLEYSDSLIYKLIYENPDKNIVISSQDNFIDNFAAIKFKLPGLYDTTSIFNRLRTSKETVLLFIRKQPLDHQMGFWDKEIGKSGDNYFYLVNIKADGK